MKNALTLAALVALSAFAVGCTENEDVNESVAELVPPIEAPATESTPAADLLTSSLAETAPIAEATAAPVTETSTSSPDTTTSSTSSNFSLGTGSSGRGH